MSTQFRTDDASERGAIHIIAAIVTALVLVAVLVAIQDWVSAKKAARSEALQADVTTQARKDALRSILDPAFQLDAERLRVEQALGMSSSKDALIAQASILQGEARADAQRKIARIIKQPPTLPLEQLLDLAFVRWAAVREFTDAAERAKAPTEENAPAHPK